MKPKNPQNELSEERRWLSIAKGAEHLEISESYLRRLLHDGRLKAVRLGNTYRLDRKDLDAWMLARKKIVPPYRIGTKPHIAAMHEQVRLEKAQR